MPDLPKMHRPAHAGPIGQDRREHDRRRRRDQPWRNWYKLKRWQDRRSAQLQERPLCERCQKEGTITEATVANHVDGHNGDEQRFFFGPLESLCKPHHDIDVQREEAAARKAKR